MTLQTVEEPSTDFWMSLFTLEEGTAEENASDAILLACCDCATFQSVENVPE